MKKSKRANTSKLKDGVDRISNLSDDILQLILSRLPTTEEVVRTSIMSTRWRYLWTSFSYSSLDLDFSRTLKSPSRYQMNKFKEFMGRVLVNKTLDLDSFHLCCSNYDNMRTIGRWIDAAITRKVKLLHLMICPMKDFKVPPCLVNSASLEVLRLVLSGSILSLPNFTGLPALRVLELNNVKLVNNDLVENFLKSCPLLEDLSLIDCWMHEIVGRVCISCPELKNLRFDNREVYQHLSGQVDINCPKLVFFEVAGYIYHVFHFERSLDSLKKAVLCPQLLKLRPQVSLADINPGPFSLGIITHTFYEEDEDDELPDPEVDVPPAPLNPKTVEVTTTVDFLTKDGLFNLLIEIPNLESLHLTIIEGPFWPCLYSNLGEDTERMRVLTDHLKRVEFVDFNGEKEKLFVARSLLEYGHVLEEMVFSWGNEATYRERSMETMKEVSKFPWASTVKLISRLKKKN